MRKQNDGNGEMGCLVTSSACCAKDVKGSKCLSLMDGLLEKDQARMQKAFDLLDPKGHEVPVGCVVWHEVQGLIAGEVNAPISQHNATAHAEILAIASAGKVLGNYRLVGCTVYVTLEPCPMCFYALMQARVQRIVFAAPDRKVGMLSCGHYKTLHALGNHHFTWTQGVLEERAAKVLGDFFLKKRG